MHKSTVISYFGSQEKLAQALRDGGFQVVQRSISDWPELIPLGRAVQIAHITRDDPRGALTVDLALYQKLAPKDKAEGRAAA